MRVAVYPGSFDPITNGHLDIIERARKVFDKVIVAILINPTKKGLFSVDERVELIKKVTKDIDNVEVESFEGLLVDFLAKKETNIIIKGLRAVSDFEYEFQMALMNNKLNSDVETVFMMTSAEYSYLSSSSVKQVAFFDGSVEGLVPSKVIGDIKEKVRKVKEAEQDGSK